MAKMIQRSRGRILLGLVLQRTCAREVAARCGVSPSCVSEWLSGTAAPSAAPRARLASIYRIYAEAWSEAPALRIQPLRRVG